MCDGASKQTFACLSVQKLLAAEERDERERETSAILIKRERKDRKNAIRLSELLLGQFTNRNELSILGNLSRHGTNSNGIKQNYPHPVLQFQNQDALVEAEDEGG